MDWYSPERAVNICRDWNKSQGFDNPAEETVCIRRDIDVRKVSIENSSPDNPIGCAITTYYEGPTPRRQFLLAPGEVKAVAINSFGSSMQYLWYLDQRSGQPLGTPMAFRTDSNQFVLRQGLNRWFVQAFKSAGFKG